MTDTPKNDAAEKVATDSAVVVEATASEPAAPEVLGTWKGMWSQGSPDTSGYGGLVHFITKPAASERPYGGYFDAIADRLAELVPAEAISKIVIALGEMTVYVPREHLLTVMKTLRDDAWLRFEMFASVSGVHYPMDKGEELHAVYELQSFTHNRRIRVETTTPDGDCHLPSVVSIYPAADWHERETWDMFGIIFDGHPHLTRIMMPDDWQGHPQRKDYPLGGIPIEYKGAVVPPPDQRRRYQ